MAHSLARSSASSADGDFDDATPPQPAAASVIQTVNIRNHIPVVLDYATANYSQWRCCFDSVLGKFGLEACPLADTDRQAQRRVEVD